MRELQLDHVRMNGLTFVVGNVRVQVELWWICSCFSAYDSLTSLLDTHP